MLKAGPLREGNGDWGKGKGCCPIVASDHFPLPSSLFPGTLARVSAEALRDCYDLPMHRPTLIEARREPTSGELVLRWEDDHTGAFAYSLLRGFCPCAACQGHHAAAIVFRPAGSPTLERVEPVGSYALSLAFADGHGTGIYSFDLLRRFCPCPQCTATLGPAPERVLSNTEASR